MTGKIPKKKKRAGVDEYGRTDLHYSSDPIEIEKFVQAGLNVNQQDDNGWTPLHFAAQNNSHAALECLLKLGADPNLYDSHGNSPLWTATMNARGNFESVSALLNAGADSLRKNKHGRSPFDMANTIKNGLDEIFDKYLKRA